MRSRPIANSLADIVASDHEVFAIVPDAAQDDMDVGMLGIPMIDADPVELRAEILFGLAHEVTGELRRSDISSASSGETMKRK
jgi:hypothetical protein